MKRSAVLGFALLGVLGGSPAGAQQSGKTYRVAILTATSTFAQTAAADTFRRALSALGYEEGKNLELLSRAADPAQLPAFAAELVRAKPDVIVAAGSPEIAAVQHATKSVPIVMLNTSDPFRFVASLAKPGGNITGLATMDAELEGKRLQLLIELVPRMQRVAVIRDPENPGNLATWRQAQSVARAHGIQVLPVDVRSSKDIDAAFRTIRNLRAGAIIVLPNIATNTDPARIEQLATAQRLPAIYSGALGGFGALLSYGASSTAAFTQATSYVDRILKGAKPADLPVAQPTTFELIVNLKTARAIGITVPQSILLQATQVIR